MSGIRLLFCGSEELDAFRSGVSLLIFWDFRILVIAICSSFRSVDWMAWWCVIFRLFSEIRILHVGSMKCSGFQSHYLFLKFSLPRAWVFCSYVVDFETYSSLF